MTEAEWLTCADPEKMLAFLWGKASDRKCRLFAVACCRRIWKLLTDERSRKAVEVAERYADFQATDEELERASDTACAVWDAEMERVSIGRHKSVEADNYCTISASMAAYNVALPLAWWGAAPAFVAPDEIAREVTGRSETEGAAQCVLIRDVFGNPFRPVSIDPVYVRWQDGTIPKLAKAIYEERGFDRLPILAETLQEAGFHDQQILAHCRQPGMHIRGCWVVDLLLGKD